MMKQVVSDTTVTPRSPHRHPREGGDPSRGDDLALDSVVLREGGCWIPAFAGMTG
jgi:hypothetical protein